MVRQRLRAGISVLSFSFGVAACADILGYEERTLDDGPYVAYEGCDGDDCSGCTSDYHVCECSPDKPRSACLEEHGYVGCRTKSPRDPDSCEGCLTECDECLCTELERCKCSEVCAEIQSIAACPDGGS